MLDKDMPEINYKDVWELLVCTKDIRIMDEGNKLTICTFVEKFVSRIYGIRKINTWLSKKKGSTFFDLMTVSDIAYARQWQVRWLHTKVVAKFMSYDLQTSRLQTWNSGIV